MADGGYTQEGIMAQVFIAFGQGSGATRVSHDAAAALRSHYFDSITQEVIDTRWKKEAVQALERVRAVGKLAAFQAMQRGDTVVSPDDVTSAAMKVETQSDTDLCPPRP